MYIFSPAKLNLCLFVLGKREDGYHDIISIVQKISIFDLIDLEFSEKRNEVKFISLWHIPEGNTVINTLDFVSQITGRFFKVSILKNIPPSGGLGGASSNAGVILKNLLNDFSQMQNLAEKIGSDVPLFLRKSPSMISGRGEKVSEIKIEKIKDAIFVVVFPGILSQTKRVYETFDDIFAVIEKNPERKEKLECLMKVRGDIRWEDFEIFLGWNDLEFAFLEIFREAKEVKNFLSKFSKFYLTGSGSSFFSVFFDLDKAKFVFERVREHFRFSWIAVPFFD